MAMLSRLFSDADGASGKEFGKAFRVTVDGASSRSQEEWRFKRGTKPKAICSALQKLSLDNFSAPWLLLLKFPSTHVVQSDYRGLNKESEKTLSKSQAQASAFCNLASTLYAEKLHDDRAQNTAVWIKSDCFVKHQPGMAGLGWM